jgi:hypothetical protein
MIKKKEKGDDDNCFWMVPISSKKYNIFMCEREKKNLFSFDL